MATSGKAVSGVGVEEGSRVIGKGVGDGVPVEVRVGVGDGGWVVDGMVGEGLSVVIGIGEGVATTGAVKDGTGLSVVGNCVQLLMRIVSSQVMRIILGFSIRSAC
jgi:hypothetical protein